MRFAAGNAQDIGDRPEQQDAFGFSDPQDKVFVAHGGFLGVVADGMGGMTHGSEASRTAVRAFLRAYQAKSPDESIDEALMRALTETNAAVVSLAEGTSQAGDVGTTLVSAVIRGDSLHWISSGDSRIYVLRNGHVTQVTADHVYANVLNIQVAEGTISRSEALSHSERDGLTSYLGQRKLQEIDQSIRPFPLQPEDSVMLCSDGLYRALSETGIAAACGTDLQQACDTLIQQALAKQRTQQDNLTVIAFAQLCEGSRRPVRTSLAWALLALVLACIDCGMGFWLGRYLRERRTSASSSHAGSNQSRPGSPAAGSDGKGPTSSETAPIHQQLPGTGVAKADQEQSGHPEAVPKSQNEQPATAHPPDGSKGAKENEPQN